MNMRGLLETRSARVAEMRQLQEAAGDADFTPEQQARWTALESEVRGLDGRMARQACIDEMERRAAAPADATPGFDPKRYSLGRALRIAAGMEPRNGYEAEIAQEVEHRAGRSPEGFFIPMGALETRADAPITSTLPVDGPGSHLIGTAVRADLYAPLAREALVVRRAGARVLGGLTGNISIPFSKRAAAATWVAENAAVTRADAGFDSVTLAPKHISVLQEVSRTMLQQASPDVEALLRADMAAEIAAGIDAAAIAGAGGAAPTGILSHAGVTEITRTGNDGDPLNYLDASTMVGAVEDLNFMGGVFLMRPSDAREAAVTPRVPAAVEAAAGFVVNDVNNTVAGRPLFTSGAVTANWVIFGAFSELFVGVWSELDVLVNPYEATAYAKGNVQIRSMATVDVQLRRAAAFRTLDLDPPP